MNSGDYNYIWQADDWPNWRYDLAALAGPMAEVSRAQGLLMGRLADVGMALRDQASLAALTEDVVKTSEIEGEQLNVESVRSSIARRLGVDIGALAPVDRHVEGVVEMVLDATANCQAPVTRERLFGWHAALFPTGYSGLARINVGGWRDDASGPMQVVSGPIGRQRVHFEAPPADRLEAEMSQLPRLGQWQPRMSRRSSRPGSAICGSSPCTRSTTATAASPAPSATCCWRAPTAARSASTACRRRSSGSARPTTTSWSAPRSGRWTSPSGSPGSSKPSHRAVDQAQHTLDAVLSQGALLAALGDHAIERAAGEVAQPAARRLRRQTHQQQMGGHRQVFAGHGAARHQRPACAGRTAEIGCAAGAAPAMN